MNFELDQRPQKQDDSMIALGVMLCNKLHAESQAAMQRSCMLGIALGYQLKSAKEMLPHGEFGRLFKKTKCEPWFAFGKRQAEKYMKLYGLFTKQLEKDDASSFNLMLKNQDIDGAEMLIERKLPGVSSTRQALLILQEKSDEKAKYVPTLSEPNTQGRIAKSAEAVVNEVEKEAQRASGELRTIATHLQEMIAAGVLLKADNEAQAELLSALSTAKNIIENTR